MSNGVLSAIKRDITDSDTPTTRKLMAFWPILLAPGLMKPVVNCWGCLLFLPSVWLQQRVTEGEESDW
ncbi:hypothetical protein CV83915_2p0209 (plasmid) [Escherichia coli]|uniref:Uncharacterized protein n=1 Tax=Escherichia coli TaxID=562 RepID=A0A2H4TKZ1_ECOLX|nr:hypothetical protein CV83915_2p0209 [Escherichia coli]